MSRGPSTSQNGQIVQKRDKDPATQLRNMVAKMEPQIANAVPRQMGPDRFLRATMTAITKNPQLALCTPGSFFICLLTSAQLGLMPGMRGGVWLVPFKNKGTLECNAIIDYRGLCALARRSGLVTDIAGEVVHEGDQFYYQLGTDRRIDHVPDFSNPDRHLQPIQFAYGTAQIKGDKIPQFAVLSWAEVVKRRKVNRGSGSEFSPWTNWTIEMAQKTGVRKVLNLAPMDTEDQLSRAMALEDGRVSEVIDSQIADALKEHGLELPADAELPAPTANGAPQLTEEEKAAGWEMSPDGEMIPPPKAEEGGAA